MVTRYLKFAEGEFYHVYNRGTDKRVIYKDQADYRRFQELLYLSNSTNSINIRDVKKQYQQIYDFKKNDTLVAIGAYCLMPNHFHILLTPVVENGVKMFMQKLSTSYVMYFNKRYERKGGLFEGNFKAQHANEDRYLKYLFSYIHLNPVKLIDSQWKTTGIANLDEAYKYVVQYKFSSLQDYIYANRIENKILNTEIFPEYFPEGEYVKQELFEWLTYNNEELTPSENP